MATLERQKPPFLLLSMMLYGTGYPFDQLGSAVPAVSPPNLSLPIQEGVHKMGNGEGLDNVQALLCNR